MTKYNDVGQSCTGVQMIDLFDIKKHCWILNGGKFYNISEIL